MIRNAEVRRASQRAYREAHRDELRAHEQAYRDSHRDERRAVQRAYSRVNRDEKRAYDRVRYRIHIHCERISVCGAVIDLSTMPPEVRELGLLLKQARKVIRQASSGSLEKTA